MTADLAIAQLLLSTLLIGVTLIGGIFRYRQSGYWRRGVHNRLQAYLLWALSGLITLSCFFPLAYFYTEHLWFESVGYADVFWDLQKIRWGFFAVCFIVAAGFMNANTAIAHILCPESREFRRWTHTQTFSFHRVVIFITLIAAFLLAAPMLLLDDVLLRYLNQPDAAVARLGNLASEEAVEDVVVEGLGNPAGEEAVEDAAVETVSEEAVAASLHFGMDRNFYLFSFPLHRWVSLWVQITIWVTCIVVGLLYHFYYRRDAHTMARVKRHLIVHGSILWVLLLAVAGWRSYVNLWNKVYTSPLTQELSTLHGLFYVDAHLEGATKIYCGVLVGVALAVVLNLFWRKRLFWYTTLVVWGLSYVLLIHVYPLGLYVWQLRAEPYDKEARHLQRHIEETRRAFELDTIKTEDRLTGLATLDVIEANPAVKENIQLWDRRVLYEALREDQIRRHYDFHPYTDVDRYTVDGEYRQVLIAAREVDPAANIKDWYRLKLQFTHGYGVCVAPVNEFIENGLPNFWVGGAPLDSKHPELEVKRPEIYYGEMTHDYAIVKTERRRRATPLDPNTVGGDVAIPEVYKWQRHTYTADSGVPLGGWFRRFCFALRFDFYLILRSERLTPESRVMFRRKIGTRSGEQLIKDRVSHIVPFLNYDPDPYIVINNGELWWIIDFYVSSQYHPNAQVYVDDTARLTENDPYMEPDFKNFNYIRNAGVAVVNAYTGAVNFYAIKQKGRDEPVMQAYQQAFPNLFKSVSEMPDGLAAHLRYPDYLTRIQAKMYGDYHQDASDFFQTTDTWSIPKETYYSEEADQEMQPYYAVLQLPGEDTVEFVNVIPFTPPEKEKRLQAWMVARCDPPNYGQRIVYILPEGADVAGPTQVEEDIDKATGQEQVGWAKTSDIIRGNLLIIPIEDALFYVETIYLQAKKSEKASGAERKPRRPKLEMVVVKAGSSELGTAKTFDAALDVIFLGQPAVSAEAGPDEAEPTLPELIRQYRDQRTRRDVENDRLLEQILNKIAESDR